MPTGVNELILNQDRILIGYTCSRKQVQLSDAGDIVAELSYFGINPGQGLHGSESGVNSVLTIATVASAC